MPSDPGSVRFETGCASTTEVVFPQTQAGQRTTAIVSVINDGDVEVHLGTLEQVLEIDGVDAGEFEIFDSPSPHPLNLANCTNTPSLPPQAWCQVTIAFEPSAAGMKTASYTFGGGAGTLSLSGPAVAQATSLRGERGNVTLGYLPTDSSNFLLRNDSNQTVQLGDLAATAPFTAGGACATSVMPGGACELGIGIVGSPTDCVAGTLTSAQSSFSMPLSYTPALPFPTRFNTRVVGNGVGTVAEVDGAFSCTTAESSSFCTYTVWGPARTFEMVATPETGSVLVGWMTMDGVMLPCGNAATCTVQSAEPSRVASNGVGTLIWFAPLSEKLITVNVVGSGRVTADGLVSSDSSFSFRVPSGRPQTLSQSTTGTFVGWSGDCTGTGACDLGTVINDRTVTATFSP